MARKLRIAVLFGGKSAEHEVSVISAKNVAGALDPKKYDVSLIGITKSGAWLPPQSLPALLESKKESFASTPERGIVLAPGGGGALAGPASIQKETFDVVFPVLHGPLGEDGTVQGLLKLADVPFVGADVLGSAVGMDKDVMKRLLRDAGIPIGAFLTVRSASELSWSDAVRALGEPVFVKPANLGSSVGISKARNEKEFTEALKLALRYDTKVLVEQFIPGREIECAVLGNEDPRASVPGEVVVHHEFYSYEAKYLDENGASLVIPAELSPELTKTVQDLAIRTFKALCCEGMGRVDSFVTKDGAVFVNEINTIPGFTSISMYPKMWEASGIPYAKLIDTLVQLAIERHQKQKALSANR